MASGYGDKDMLRDALALANSFKKSDPKDKKNRRKETVFTKDDFRKLEDYRGTSPARRGSAPSSDHGGPLPTRQRHYHDAGAFNPQSQNMNTGQSILGSSGMDFLRRQEQVMRPEKAVLSESPPNENQVPKPEEQIHRESQILKSDQDLSPGLDNPAHTVSSVNAVSKSSLTSKLDEKSQFKEQKEAQGAKILEDPNSSHATSSTNDPVQPTSGASSGSIMETFLAFAPPDVFQKFGAKSVSPSQNTVVPANKGNTEDLNLPTPAQAKSSAHDFHSPSRKATSVSSHHLMDVESPEQTDYTEKSALDRFYPSLAGEETSSTDDSGSGIEAVKELPCLDVSRPIIPGSSNTQSTIPTPVAANPNQSVTGLSTQLTNFDTQDDQALRLRPQASLFTPGLENPPTSGNHTPKLPSSTTFASPLSRTSGPVSSHAGENHLVQTGYSTGHLCTVTEVHFDDGFLIPGRTGGQLMMQTPVGFSGPTQAEGTTPAPTTAASNSSTKPKKGLEHSMWAR